ncbi:MAG: hypothetical protein A3K76_06895 [Euryarchaeota archaeon RBG_13_57_23]|nr:MAG: hypothetical protein A3K76_06895 [Euryarchaeota archaeon RBG_13_57_23]
MLHKAHKFEAEGDFVEHLEGDKRRERLPLDKIIPRMNLSKSDLVVDLGPGTGYFTFPMAKSAKQVIGVEIEDKMLKVIKQRTEERSVDNVSIVRGDMNRMPIADSSADHVLAAFVYHEVGNQAELMAECARILKRGGRLTVIDFQRRIESDGPPIWVRKSPANVKKTASKWFELASSDGSKGYYQLMFSRN